jgi:hypothetical protein
LGIGPSKSTCSSSIASRAASLAATICGGSGRSGGVDASSDGEGRPFSVKYASMIRVFCSMADESVTILLVVAIFVLVRREVRSLSERCVEI